MNRTLSYILAILLLCGNLIAQNIHLDRFDVTSGLSHNSVYSLEIDSFGNIWSGTLNGLNLFNGYKFEIFNNDSKPKYLTGNYVVALQADSAGGIWMAIVNGGINYYDPNQKQFTHYSTPLLNRFIMEGFNDLIIRPDSSIWIKNDMTVGLFSINTKELLSYTNGEVLHGIIPYNQSSIMAFGELGLFRLTIKNDSIISTLINETPIHEIICHNDTYFVANSVGIEKYNLKFELTDTLLLYNNQVLHPESSEVTTLLIDKNKLWIGSTNGLFEYDLGSSGSPKTVRFLSHSFPDERITRLKRDKDNNLWIGTINTGINFYSRTKNQFDHIIWEHKDSRNNGQIYGTSTDPVGSICKTRSGDLWLGFESRGVGVIKADGRKKYYYHYYNENGEAQKFNFVRCINEDSYNNIWFASWDNLCYYNKRRDRIETLNYKYKWHWPYASFVIKEFQPGKLTFTGNNMIGTLDLNSGEISTLPTHSNDVYLWDALRDIILDSFNNLWVVQNNNGLVKINLHDTSFTHINTTEHGLNNFKVYSLEVDGDSLWIATNTGLDLFSIKQNKVIRTFKEKDGLSNNVVYSVHLDKNNKLWMSTSKGISQLDTKTGQISVYLQNNFFSGNAFFYDSTTIYFGGYQGAVSFDPYKIRNDRLQPNPMLDDFFLFNQKIQIGDTVNNEILLSKRLSVLSELRLRHKQNSFSFTFKAFPISYPNNHRFRFRLVNMQEEWVYPESGIRTANYTTVDPGDYVFQVAVSSVKGIWSPVKEIAIRIIPPYWQRFWFKLAVVLFLSLSVLAFIRYRIAQIRNINLLLEKRVDEQTRELKEQNQQIKTISEKLHEADESKLRFFTNISHEFRTPLTLILGHLSTLQSKHEEHSSSIIKNNALRLLNLVNQLIDIRKMDQDQLKLHVSKFDLISFTLNIIDSFQLLANNKKISLQFYSQQDHLEVWLDIDKIEKIIYNLISNAIKYTPSGKDILIEINSKPDIIELAIEDNGIGIAANDLERIFDRFYRSDNNVTSGHGIGLSLTKGLTEIQQGIITATSEIDKGTRFTISFKQGKAHFKPDDFSDIVPEERFLTEPYKPPLDSINMARDHKILIVEDNTELKDYIANLLHTHFLVRTAENGKDALEILQDFTPDLIVSDIMMPVMDGIRFCTEVKAKIETSHIPFVILTARSDSETKIDGFTQGIDAFIEKPFDPNIFLTRIIAILTNREQVKKYLTLSSKSSEAIDKTTFSKNDKEFWKKVNQIINENYHDTEFNTELLSESMHMSRTTFYRKFKSLTGLNTADHIRKFRLYKAAELLLEKEFDVAQVSISVGFKSLSQFRINFKQEFGKTPSEYQKRK